MNARTKSRYFADDKDIHDLLSSAKLKLPVSRLLEIARLRGIVLSAEEERSDLVEYLSMLGFSWHDLNELLDSVDMAARAPKDATSRIPLKTTFAQVHAVAEQLQDERAKRGESYRIDGNGKDRVRVQVDYTEFDLSRTRLRQQLDRTMEITIEIHSAEVSVRHQQSARAQEILDTITDLLANKTKSTLERQQLTLTGFTVEQRTQFFFELFKIKDCKLVDVSRVRVVKPDDEISLESDSDDTEDEDDVEEAADDAKYAGWVRNVTLDGRQVTATREWAELQRRGACINGATWVVQETVGDERQFDLQAGFMRANDATGFFYSVKLVRDFNEKTGAPKKTPRAPNEMERILMGQAIAAAAESAKTNAQIGSQGASSKPAKKKGKKRSKGKSK